MKTNLMVWDVIGKEDYVTLGTKVVLVDDRTSKIIAIGFFTEPQIREHWEDVVKGFIVLNTECIVYIRRII